MASTQHCMATQNMILPVIYTLTSTGNVRYFNSNITPI